jgi:DNA processing protein
VTEAPRQSGALITAGFAGEQGRDVFAVPGSIFSKASTGALQLIQDGAKLVMSVDDILSELNLATLMNLTPLTNLTNLTSLTNLATSLQRAEPENGIETRLLELLGGAGEALHVDELSHRLGLPVATISATLAILELRGMVVVSAPMTYMTK